MKLKTREMTLVAMFAALTAVGAFIKIPLPYVPFTLQFFFCAFAGILLGSRLGAFSQFIYVFTGLCGAPIFTEGGGFTYVLKPTFGYLIGFILCAFVIGKVVEAFKSNKFIHLLLAVLAGLFVTFLLGVPYLYMIMNLYLGKAKDVMWAVNAGFIPFIGGDIVLSVIVASVASTMLPILRKAGLVDALEAKPAEAAQ